MQILFFGLVSFPASSCPSLVLAECCSLVWMDEPDFTLNVISTCLHVRNSDSTGIIEVRGRIKLVLNDPNKSKAFNFLLHSAFSVVVVTDVAKNKCCSTQNSPKKVLEKHEPTSAAPIDDLRQTFFHEI